ncbi:hypothetical protein BY458DRAFT_533163 [Sporodiniella umbellata]|nr:hypothetical protein BY458DRAFT_533163 [Sporodiniella umbellata]
MVLSGVDSFSFQRDISCRQFQVKKHKSKEEEWTTKKDQFIELAQAALEQARKEEKGVLQELVELFIQHTGAPKVAEAFWSQLKSQEMIEKLAERHCTRKETTIVAHPLTLKEPDCVRHTSEQIYQARHYPISDYLWRLFRLLILASLVGLVYHFLCTDPKHHPSLF